MRYRIFCLDYIDAALRINATSPRHEKIIIIEEISNIGIGLTELRIIADYAAAALTTFEYCQRKYQSSVFISRSRSEI